MRSPTEVTIEASVMNGVQKAFQRARRRSALSSSNLSFDNGLSTIFTYISASLFSMLVYYERRPKSNRP
jgi:hypothetical protein